VVPGEELPSRRVFFCNPTTLQSDSPDKKPHVSRKWRLKHIHFNLFHKSSERGMPVFNTLGQPVAQMVNGEVEAGYHEVQFDGKNLSSGLYFYRIEAGSFVETKRLLLIR
jgi:hypothetical protein